MRSFLFVPGDSTREYESAKKTAADALILDLEDSIAPDQRGPSASWRSSQAIHPAFAKMDGKMLDKPHLRAAEKIVASRGK